MFIIYSHPFNLYSFGKLVANQLYSCYQHPRFSSLGHKWHSRSWLSRCRIFLYYLTFQSFECEYNIWRLFQNSSVCTMLDTYIYFYHIKICIIFLSWSHHSTVLPLLWQHIRNNRAIAINIFPYSRLIIGFATRVTLPEHTILRSVYSGIRVIL